MSLKALKKAGALLGDDPVKRQVNWTNPAGEDYTFDVWVKPMSFGMALDLNEKSDRQQIASALSALVLFEDDDGARVPLEYEDALNLDPSFGLAILQVVSSTTAKKKSAT